MSKSVWKNIKTKKEYVVVNDNVCNATNKDDGKKMYLYRPKLTEDNLILIITYLLLPFCVMSVSIILNNLIIGLLGIPLSIFVLCIINYIRSAQYYVREEKEFKKKFRKNKTLLNRLFTIYIHIKKENTDITKNYKNKKIKCTKTDNIILFEHEKKGDNK